MPYKPSGPCRHPGCPALATKTNRGFCPNHGPIKIACRVSTCPEMAYKNGYCYRHWKESRKRYDDARGTPPERGYDQTWGNLRLLYLAEHCLCEECKKAGILKAAQEVHHVIPISQRPDLRLDPENLMALCKPCHSRLKGKG